jgi:release factor glutamine methyltransferase
MYAPAEDTLLLAECALQYRGKWALEIGVGSGAVAEALARNFDNVVGSDIDLESLRYCRTRDDRIMLVCCDAASALRGRFDMIASNPPYLPDDREKDVAVHGGPRGTEVTAYFIRSSLPLLAPGGRMFVVVSSLADQSALDSLVQEMKLKKRVVKEKALFYERLSVVELTF